MKRVNPRRIDEEMQDQIAITATFDNIEALIISRSLVNAARSIPLAPGECSKRLG